MKTLDGIVLLDDAGTVLMVRRATGRVVRRVPFKAAVHWVCVNALSAESSPKLTWDAMGLRADSARRLSVRAEPLTR